MSGKLPVAADVSVYIPDLKAGVPGSDLPVWQYKRDVDPNWKPGPDYPGIKAETLPTRRTDMAREAVLECLKVGSARERGPGDYNPLPSGTPVIQVVGRSESVDIRQYQTQEWVNPVYENGKQVKPGGMVDLPPEKHKPFSPAASLFLNTVHECFAQHLPLGIRPECLMWMVLHEIGVTVRMNPDAYRHLFTTSAKKKLIDVQINGLDIHSFDQTGLWAEGIARLHTALRGEMPPGLLEHMLPAISTHDLESETASMVAVLDAASPYYDYLGRTCCGIPAIRLFGQAQDYDNIVAACGQLSEVFSAHLGEYFTHLLPLLKEIADTAAGRKPADNGFWSSIYNHYSGSGTDDMDGWITAFVNYKCVGGRFHAKPAELYDWRANLKKNEGSWGRGIHREDIPNHISSVPFLWNYGKNHGGGDGEFAGRQFKQDNGGNGATFDCRLIGGFLAVEDVDGYATPVLSYAVVRGDELEMKVNEKDRTWTVQAEGQTPVTAKMKSVYAMANPDGRAEVYEQNNDE